MSEEKDLFSTVADKLTSTQKALLGLVTAALVFAMADLIAGRHNRSHVERELVRQVEFTRSAMDATSRLRFMLSHLYPDRALGERQRLTLLVQDIRRTRRALDSERGIDAALQRYQEPVLPISEGDVTRVSLNTTLNDLRKLAYFKGPQPGSDFVGDHWLIDVGINDISAEAVVSQQPVVHVALLLLGTLAFPGELADALENFVRTANPEDRGPVVELHHALQTLKARTDTLNRAYVPGGDSTEAAADKLLNRFLKRSVEAGDSPSVNAAIRESKYESPSADALSQLLLELRSEYYAEDSRARGERSFEVPGSVLRLPGYVFLLSLPVLILGMIAFKVWLTLQVKEPHPSAGTSLRAAEVKYGFLVLRLLHINAERGAAAAVAQFLLVGVGPSLLVWPLLEARGMWTLWFSVPLAVFVLVAELWLAYRVFGKSDLLEWPSFRGYPPD